MPISYFCFLFSFCLFVSTCYGREWKSLKGNFSKTGSWSANIFRDSSKARVPSLDFILFFFSPILLFKSIFNSCKCTCFWLMECKLYWSQVVRCILFVLIYIIYWLNYIFDLLTFLLISLVQAYNQSIYFAGWHLYLISYPFIFPLLTSEILERRPTFSLLSRGLYFLLSKVHNFCWICFIPLFFHLSYFALVCLYFLWVCFSLSCFSWLCFSIEKQRNFVSLMSHSDQFYIYLW